MTHDVPLISTIAVGLSLAFVFGVVAAKLRLPPILGYLLAGVLVGPFTPGFVADLKLAEQLSEIGIVLLMFGVGLHFSMKDLMAVKKIAIPGALGQIAAATGMGVVAAHFWGWSLAGGLIFGLALSVASTVVLLRALEERGIVRSINGQIAVGWLIVEDLVMVLALVLIPVIGESLIESGGQSVPMSVWGPALLVTLGKVGLFVAFMMVVGVRVLPWMLTLVAGTGSRELFTLSVFAAAVGVAYGAAMLFGVSFALGAFFAGMMLKESELCHKVAENALPFQDAFAVLFFVAVGMLFDPVVLLNYPLHVLVVVAIIIVGKSIAAGVIVLLLRYPLNTALLVSASLAQIGEFSFILASLGRMVNLLTAEGYSRILAGAIISITLNPVIFRGVPHIHSWFEKQPWAKSIIKFSDDGLCHLSSTEKRKLKDLTIVVGYGRVGQHVVRKALEHNLNIVVVDQNRERIEDLRKLGVSAIVGDATQQEVFKEAAIQKAKALIIAVPTSFEAHQIIAAGRAVKPSIEVLIRVHSDEERDHFNEEGKNKLAVMGEQEIANRMISHLLDKEKSAAAAH